MTILKSALLAATLLATIPPAYAQKEVPRARRVTIEWRDLTGTQGLSAAPWVSHSKELRLWEEGKPASLLVQVLAEDGNPEFILGTAVDDQARKVFGDVAVGLPNVPGRGRQVVLTVDAEHPLVSGAWMLGQTNDGFAGIASVDAYSLTKPLSIEVYALDAGTERNTEAQADTAALGGLGRIAENGVVARHPGIRGDKDIPASFRFDAAKPVGQITITPSE